MAENITITGVAEAPPRISEWKRFRRVFLSRGMVVFGIVVLVILLFVAIFANLLAPYDPFEPATGPSLSHPATEHWRTRVNRHATEPHAYLLSVKRELA